MTDHWTRELADAHLAKFGPVVAPGGAAVLRGEPRKMTQTEMEFKILFLAAYDDVKFEGVTFNMQNGHVYTGDFVYWDNEGQFCCDEVKGEKKLLSYQRARLAFDQCRQEFPKVRFRWAEKRDGKWEVT